MNAFTGRAPVPAHVNGHAIPKAHGGAVVIGSGRTVWTDLRAIGRPELAVFAVNDMIIFAPKVTHAVSHHAQKIPHWLGLRSQTGVYRKPREVRITAHSSMPGTAVTKVWPRFKGDGSSALLAVRIARALGHDPVYVAGVPLDGYGYIWSEPEHPEQFDFARFRGAWQKSADELRGHVFSPSGYLRDLLGWPVAALAQAGS